MFYIIYIIYQIFVNIRRFMIFGKYIKNIKDLISWVLQCDEFVVDGTDGIIFDIPFYLIMPKDFLKYTQIDLHDNK